MCSVLIQVISHVLYKTDFLYFTLIYISTMATGGIAISKVYIDSRFKTKDS
jgi:hypothetical protein